MNTIRSNGRTLQRASTLVLLAGCAAGLAACYVLPIDPRTGQPYAPVSHDAGYSGGGPVAALPVPAPLQPQPTQLAVRLYPLNAQANTAGMLSALVIDNNAGHGSFSVPYLGDVLQGESTRVDTGYAGFGAVHQQVLGTTARTFGGSRGIANAHGARGVNAQCEYVLTGPSAGTGVCRFSDGANYQMHFGG